MEEIYWFLLYIATAIVVSIIASKRGRSGWAFFSSMLIAAPILVALIGRSTGGNGVAAAFGAFLVPVVGFVAALSLNRRKQVVSRADATRDRQAIRACRQANE